MTKRLKVTDTWSAPCKTLITISEDVCLGLFLTFFSSILLHPLLADVCEEILFQLLFGAVSTLTFMFLFLSIFHLNFRQHFLSLNGTSKSITFSCNLNSLAQFSFYNLHTQCFINNIIHCFCEKVAASFKCFFTRLEGFRDFQYFLIRLSQQRRNKSINAR